VAWTQPWRRLWSSTPGRTVSPARSVVARASNTTGSYWTWTGRGTSSAGTTAPATEETTLEDLAVNTLVKRERSRRKAREIVNKRPALQVKHAAEVAETGVDWLWEPRIPLGMITLIDGDPDMAKSTLTLDFVARVTTGFAFPDGTGAAEPANALIISAEDNVAPVVKPRLRIAGADLTKVLFVERPQDELGRIVPLSIPEDLADIEAVVTKHQVRLVVIDPIAAYWGEEILTHNDASIRKAMAPLKEVAERTGAAVIVVRHLNKSGEAKGMYRGGGSIAIIAAARSGLLAGKHPESGDAGERALVRIKNNLAPPFDAWVYRSTAVEDPLRPGRTLPRIEWLRTEPLTDEDVLRGDDARRRAPARHEAEVALRAVLADGPRRVDDVKKAMVAGGHSWPTVQRAADSIGVTKRPVYGEPGHGITAWEWQLLPPGMFDFNDLMRQAGIEL
jgi:AAA domain